MREYLADQPIACQIHVSGHAEQELLSHLVGLTVSQDRFHSGNLLLSGVTTDQAALVGLINTLYSFGLTIIDMHCCPADQLQQTNSFGDEIRLDACDGHAQEL